MTPLSSCKPCSAKVAHHLWRTKQPGQSTMLAPSETLQRAAKHCIFCALCKFFASIYTRMHTVILSCWMIICCVSRLTCLVAEVCAIQLQAQEIHEAGRGSTHPKSPPLQRNHKHEHAVQHHSAKLRSDREGAQDKCTEHAAGHGLHVAHMGKLILQALQYSARTHDSQRRDDTGEVKSQQHNKWGTGSREHSKATENSQPSRPHGKPTEISQVSPAELQACWQGQEERRGDTPAGSRDHPVGKAVSRTEEAGSPALAPHPEATLGRWHRCAEEAGDHKSLIQVSGSGHAADTPHVGAQAHDGRCDRLLTMLQAELVLHGCHTGSQEPSQSQLLSIPSTARTGAFSGQAGPRYPITYPGQVTCRSRLQQSSKALLSSGSTMQGVPGSVFSPRQQGSESMRGPRQAEWDSSISAVVDPDKVVKTRSGLRLRADAAGHGGSRRPADERLRLEQPAHECGTCCWQRATGKQARCKCPVRYPHLHAQRHQCT